MAHSALGAWVQAAAASAADETGLGTTADDGGLSRRHFLAGLGAISAGAMLATGTAAAAAPKTSGGDGPRVAVVGGGLAGLTCAYRLAQAGVAATVYEANSRLGGRCWTLRGAFDDGQLVERGGELIDQSHTAIRQLSQELRLDLDNVLAAQANGTEDVYFFDGARYSFDEATRDLKAIWQVIHRDLTSASYPTTYRSSTEAGRALDAMSITDWIETRVPGGMASKLGQLLDQAYDIEYGAPCSDQSALNLLYLLGYSGQGQLRIFGPSNEKYRVRGGNDALVSGLLAGLDQEVRAGWSLRSIQRRRDGSYALAFATTGANRTVVADRVVIALPFSILRRLDFASAGFSALKARAINELGMGTNAKLQLQFRTRHWEQLRSNGATYADTGYQATWDPTRAQPGRSGILNDYVGSVGANWANRNAAQLAPVFLDQIEPLLPGLRAEWNGRSQLDWWPGNPYQRGSYSYWKVGQYTAFASVEAEIEGACHFAGEHTSLDAQGYLEGAVESGERAANEVLDATR